MKPGATGNDVTACDHWQAFICVGSMARYIVAMTGPIWFEFLLAGVSALLLALQVVTGKLHLHRAPEGYRRATRATDPGRYWAFVIGLSLVTVVMFAEAFYRSFH